MKLRRPTTLCGLHRVHLYSTRVNSHRTIAAGFQLHPTRFQRDHFSPTGPRLIRDKSCFPRIPASFRENKFKTDYWPLVRGNRRKIDVLYDEAACSRVKRKLDDRQCRRKHRFISDKVRPTFVPRRPATRVSIKSRRDTTFLQPLTLCRCIPPYSYAGVPGLDLSAKDESKRKPSQLRVASYVRQATDLYYLTPR